MLHGDSKPTYWHVEVASTLCSDMSCRALFDANLVSARYEHTCSTTSLSFGKICSRNHRTLGRIDGATSKELEPFVWTLMGTSFCTIYGVRKWWSAILDGHKLCRLSIGLKASYRQAIEEISSAAEIQNSHVFDNLQGLVGYMYPGESVRKIGCGGGQHGSEAQIIRIT